MDESELLFWLSLIPFATEWVGAAHAHALPAATYGVVALGAALAYFALVRSILRANPADTHLAAAVGRDVKGTVSPVLYAWHRAGLPQPLRRLRLLHRGLVDLVHSGPTADSGTPSLGTAAILTVVGTVHGPAGLDGHRGTRSR